MSHHRRADRAAGLLGVGNGAKARQEGDRAHCHHGRCAKVLEKVPNITTYSLLLSEDVLQGRKLNNTGVSPGRRDIVQWLCCAVAVRCGSFWWCRGAAVFWVAARRRGRGRTQALVCRSPAGRVAGLGYAWMRFLRNGTEPLESTGAPKCQ